MAILDGSIKDFIKEFDKLNHVELSESCGLNELQKLVLDKKSFSDLRELQGVASSLAGGLASGAMAGALTAFGAYGVAGALATASTGTAIASLSGAAATNATLAFFGGGSLAIFYRYIVKFRCIMPAVHPHITLSVLFRKINVI